jgi:hypothetical protein
MKPAFCEKHGVQKFVLSSPRLAAAIAQDESIKETDLRRLQIESLGKTFEYFVDREFLDNLLIASEEQILNLKDRDKKSKQLNDRLIIQKIVREMKWVCPVCLSTVISRAV